MWDQSQRKQHIWDLLAPIQWFVLHLASIALNILYILSMHPFVRGWYAEALSLSIPNWKHSSLVRELSNWVLWSVRSTWGRPVLENVDHNASATVLAEIERNGMASGHFVAKHIIVKMNLTPPFALGRGRTMSTAHCSKGSVSNGLSTTGTLSWQVLHDLQYLATSLEIEGQVNLLSISFNIFLKC